MFHPDTPERRERDGRSKKEILLEMKRFCEQYKIKPIKVFDGTAGIYFVFPLQLDQSVSQDEIWESKEMEGIKKFFIEKGYSVSLLKHYFNTGLFGDFKYGKEKINLFIGFDNTVKDFIGVLKQSGKEIKFD